jgi:hypothetical protein
MVQESGDPGGIEPKVLGTVRASCLLAASDFAQNRLQQALALAGDVSK